MLIVWWLCLCTRLLRAPRWARPLTRCCCPRLSLSLGYSWGALPNSFSNGPKTITVSGLENCQKQPRQDKVFMRNVGTKSWTHHGLAGDLGQGPLFLGALVFSSTEQRHQELWKCRGSRPETPGGSQGRAWHKASAQQNSYLHGLRLGGRGQIHSPSLCCSPAALQMILSSLRLQNKMVG